MKRACARSNLPFQALLTVRESLIIEIARENRRRGYWVLCTELAFSNRDCTVFVFVMPPSDPEQPPTKRGKYAAYSLEEKVWLLDHAAKNPRVSADDLGKALAAHVNAQLPGQ
jgi:hypothetical protein